MSGHGANSIFFNKKIKTGRPEHFLSPHPLHPTTSHFYFIPYLLKVDVICVSPLIRILRWTDILTPFQKFMFSCLENFMIISKKVTACKGVKEIREMYLRLRMESFQVQID